MIMDINTQCQKGTLNHWSTLGLDKHFYPKIRSRLLCSLLCQYFTGLLEMTYQKHFIAHLLSLKHFRRKRTRIQICARFRNKQDETRGLMVAQAVWGHRSRFLARNKGVIESANSQFPSCPLELIGVCWPPCRNRLAEACPPRSPTLEPRAGPHHSHY